MIIGCPKEIKPSESRVALTPAGVRELSKNGHTILVETAAGAASGFTDADYKTAGATIIPTAAQVWADADLIVKVKEPQASEWPHMRDGQVLFTYLHLAADPDGAQALMDGEAAGDFAHGGE